MRPMNPYAAPEVRPLAHRNHRHHLHHQQSRYAHVSSSSRPPNFPSFSDSPNRYATQTLHHQHHHLHHQQSHHLPPPIQHPSPPAYHPSPAPPRPLTVPQPQYEFSPRAFNPIDDDRDRGSTYLYHHHHHHALVDRDHRLLGGYDSPVVGNRAEFLDRRQNIGDNLVHRPYSNANLNIDVHHRAVEHRAASSYRPVHSSRPDQETISRVRMREDYEEGFSFNQQDDLLCGSSRWFVPVADGYDNELHRNERGDNTSGRHSWVHNRENTQEFDSFSEIKDYGKDFGTVAFKQEYHGSEFGRYSSPNRRNREIIREYGGLNPKKQPQKKSAFLRLQMPRFTHRNRDNERHYSSNYHDDNASGSLSFKGKGQGQFNCSDFGSRDSGEGGSVDLDVSFKSNTLIAKTIVPPSSYSAVTEKDSIPLSKKLKSAIVSDKESASLSHDKLNQNDEKLNSSSSRIGAAISTSKNSKQSHENVGASDAQFKGNLGHLEGVVSESDVPCKSVSSLLPVSKVTNVSSSTSEVGNSNMGSVVDKAGIDLQCCKDAVTKGQDSKDGGKSDVVSDKAGKSIGSTQGKSEDKWLPVEAPSVKDAVPEGQDSSAGPKRDVISGKDGKAIGSDQDKTVDNVLPEKAYPFKCAVSERQDSGAGANKVVVSEKDGKNGDSNQKKNAEKVLLVSKLTNVTPSTSEVGKSNLSFVVDKAGLHPQHCKDAVPEGQNSKDDAKRDMVFDEVGKSVGSSQGKTEDEGLPGKAPSVKDAVPEGQDSSGSPKRDVISGKDAKIIGSGQRKTAATKRQDSGAGHKKVVVSDKDGKNGGSRQSKPAEKVLRGEALSVKDAVPEVQDSNSGPKRDVISGKDGKNIGSGQDKTDVPERYVAKRVVVSRKDGKNIGWGQDKTDVPERYVAKRVVVSHKDGKNGGSRQRKTAENALPGKAPSLKVARNKKIVKKVIKKVVTHRADPLNQQTSRKHDDPVKAGSHAASASCEGSGSFRDEIEFHSVALSQDCGLTQNSNDAGLLRQIDQIKGASHSISSRGCGKDTNGSNVLCGNKDGDYLPSSFCSITCVETKIGTADANNDFQIVSSSTKDLTVPLAQADAEIRMDEFSGQFPQDAKCLLLENQAGKAHLARDRSTTCLSNRGGINVQDGCRNIDGSLPKTNATFVPEEDLEDLTIVSSKESIDAAECNNSQAHQLTPVLCEDYQSIFKAGACCVSGSSSTVSEQNIMGLSSVLPDDARGQLPLVDDQRNLDNGSEENPQNFVSTVEDCAPTAGRSCDGISQVDPVSSGEPDTCRKPVDVTCSGPSHIEDTISNLSIKDPDHPPVFSSSGGLTAGLPATASGLGASHERELVDVAQPSGTNVSVNFGSDSGDGRTSPVQRKRRSVCSPNQVSFDAMIPQDDDIALDADMTASVVWMQSTSWDSSIQPEVGGTDPSSDALQGAASVSTQEETGVLLKDNRQVGYSNVTSSARNDQLPDVHLGSYLGESVFANGESLSRKIIEGVLEENFPAVSSMHDHENTVIDQERCVDRKLDLDPSEKQVTSECDRLKIYNPEINFGTSDRKLFPSNIENDASLSLKDESPSVSPYLSVSTDVNTVYASKSNDEVMESVPDMLSDRGSPNVYSAKISGDRASPSALASKGVAKNNNTDHGENLAERGWSVSADSALTSLSHDSLVDYSSDHAVETEARCSLGNNAVISSNGSKSMNCSLNAPSTEPYGRMNWQSHVIQRAFPGHSSFTATNSKISSSNPTSKSNTWRRTNSPLAAPPGHNPSVGTLPAKRPLQGKNEKLQNTSYIRKGNSLVRKPVFAAPQTHFYHDTVPAYTLNSLDVHDLKKSTTSGHDDGISNIPIHLRTGGRKAPMEKPETPPQCSTDDLPKSDVVSSASLSSFQAASPPVVVLGNSVSDPTASAYNEVLKTSEDARMTSQIRQEQTVSVDDSGNQKEIEDESLMASNFNRITYVKRKRNQLVATVNDSDLPIHKIDKLQFLPSKGYYKRKRNQLIRTSIDSAEETLPDKSNMKGKLSANINFSGTRRSLKGNSTAVGDNRSLSAIRRLMLLRKRDTVYVRSSHGFSLRKSKVVSVGGRSLKWSKSIERQTKKASEDATRAVAAVEKEKRQKNCSPFGSVTKNKSRSLRERIFRIGNVCYKMDASRNSLIRISDDESSLSAASQPGTDAKKSYVPRRLLIGNDEYVRIGNGNQLVRNPKKRTRVLANEKVKLSLHTARLKLAKKRKYCQFFTRFGKCNKGDGKCPYIHDPSKIAVCTKFLSGSCSNKECKLTHKVIPERMPDCSYFLQGLCKNRKCPYRHVNVNPNSSVCEGFLRGYCADGNECRKKHSYVCPIYESTGNCHLGSKCKLHHPKSRTSGKKRKRSKEKKKNAMGRYFGGSNHVRASDPGTSITEWSSDENSIKNANENLFEGNLADYISLGFIDEDDEEEGAEEIVHAVGGEESDDPDMELDDIDKLIKPIAIMNVKA